MPANEASILFLLQSQSNKRARSYLSCRQKARMLTLPTGESEKTERLKRKHYERVAQVAHGRASIGCEFVRFRQHEMRTHKVQLSVVTLSDSYHSRILRVLADERTVHGQAGWGIGVARSACGDEFWFIFLNSDGTLRWGIFCRRTKKNKRSKLTRGQEKSSRLVDLI